METDKQDVWDKFGRYLSTAGVITVILMGIVIFYIMGFIQSHLPPPDPAILAKNLALTGEILLLDFCIILFIVGFYSLGRSFCKH